MQHNLPSPSSSTPPLPLPPPPPSTPISSSPLPRHRCCRKRRLPSPSLPSQPITETPLQTALRQVQTDASLSPRAKAERIQALYAERRRLFLQPNIALPVPHSTFPGAGASAGCPHYQRKCWIKAHCCGRFYPCRRCHDDKENHEIDRHATQQVGCVECGDVQPVAPTCRRCGVRFARYFCAVCKFYDDTPGREAYHCDRCGICRVGKGLGIDYHHCEGCGTCLPIENVESHPCHAANGLDVHCPICREYLKTSTEPVVFMRCGHVIHKECLHQHTAKAYTCPLCKKSLTDMSDYFQQLDERLAKETLPPEMANRRTRVLCRDCDERSVVRFHFVHHKCAECGSYNTQVLGYEDGGGRWMRGVPTSTPMGFHSTATTTSSESAAAQVEETR